MNEEDKINEFIEKSRSGEIQAELIRYFKSQSKSKKLHPHHEEVLNLIQKKEAEIERIENEIILLKNKLSLLLQEELDSVKV